MANVLILVLLQSWGEAAVRTAELFHQTELHIGLGGSFPFWLCSYVVILSWAGALVRQEISLSTYKFSDPAEQLPNQQIWPINQQVYTYVNTN